MNLPSRILATPEAEALIARLTMRHGPLMFHQSGGCCDGSAPMCFPRGEFRVGGQDVLLGHIAGDVPVWVVAAQFDYVSTTPVTVDLVPGGGGALAVEGQG